MDARKEQLEHAEQEYAELTIAIAGLERLQRAEAPYPEGAYHDTDGWKRAIRGGPSRPRD
jgi:hypothetical protein